MMSATPAAMTTKKLIPEPTAQSPSNYTKSYGNSKGKKKPRNSSVVTGPKVLNPYASDK